MVQYIDNKAQFYLFIYFLFSAQTNYNTLFKKYYL